MFVVVAVAANETKRQRNDRLKRCQMAKNETNRTRESLTGCDCWATRFETDDVCDEWRDAVAAGDDGRDNTENQKLN